MNKFEKRSRDSYNKKAADYDNSSDGRFTVRFKEMLLKAVSIPSGSAVLDIACGNGRFLHTLSDYYNFKGYGTDISEKMVDCARLLNPGMSFDVASCDKLPYGTEVMDVITVCAAFHHFPDVLEFAYEANRILKIGGRIYIAEIYCPSLIRIIVNPFVPLSKAGDVRLYSPRELQEHLEKTGFRIDSFERDGYIQLITAVKQ